MHQHPAQCVARAAVAPVLSEFKSKGYVTLAFPTLFPNGRGHFEEPRDHPLKWEEWCLHLMRFYDGRFTAASLTFC